MTVGFYGLVTKSKKRSKGKRGEPGRFVTLRSGRVIFLPKGKRTKWADVRDKVLAGKTGGVGYATASEKSFAKALGENLAKKYAPYVTRYSPQEYQEMGAKCYVSETGRSGFAIKPDGDIISVFSKPGAKEGKWAIWHAIANGGTKLDCFDGFLAKEFYPPFGFKEYDRWTWDDQYAPEGWDYEKDGRPDVVLMRLEE